MLPELSPEMQRIIDEARERSLRNHIVDHDLDEIERRGARVDRVRDVARNIPKWARKMPASELVGWLNGPMRAQADHWGPGVPGEPDKPCSPCLLLMGPTQAGKTRCAASIARRLLSWGVKRGGAMLDFAAGIVWADADRLAQARREHPLGQGEAPEVTEAIKASLLVLDDLGQERDPEVCRAVIRARAKHVVPIIVTTGLNPHLLAEQYGADLVRRMHERNGKPGTVIDLFPRGAS